MKNPKVIVGLGNAVEKYNGTRHNFGFDVIDSFVEKYHLKYDNLGTIARFAKTNKSGFLRKKIHRPAIICRPNSYMNTTGPKVKSILEKLGARVQDLLVIYDDIDLDLGRIRLRPAGSAGGHKGIKSIIRSLGTKEFSRFKLGIGPQGDIPSEKFVLASFSRSELPIKKQVIDTALDVIIDFCNKSIESLMSKYNGVDYSENDCEK